MPSSPHAVIFTVWLFGGEPGLCVVLARLSFQVPMFLSAATAGLLNSRTARTIRATVVLCFRFIGLPGDRRRYESVYRILPCNVNSAQAVGETCAAQQANELGYTVRRRAATAQVMLACGPT